MGKSIRTNSRVKSSREIYYVIRAKDGALWIYEELPAAKIAADEGESIFEVQSNGVRYEKGEWVRLTK